MSDRYKKRYRFLLFSCTLMLFGILAIVGNGGIPITLVGIFILTTYIYPAFPALVSWLGQYGSSKRSIGMAFQIGLGSMSGGVGPNFYRVQDAPGYRLGHGLETGLIVMEVTPTIMMAFTLQRIIASRNVARRIKKEKTQKKTFCT